MLHYSNLGREWSAETIRLQSVAEVKNGASLKSLMSRGNIMQRTFLLFAFFWISVASSFAQDVISLKNGEDIQGLVLEIGVDDIKYKKFDNPNGPSYTLKKSDVLMIRYFNGSKDVFADETSEHERTIDHTSAPTIRSIVQSQDQIDNAEFTRLRKNDRAMEAFLKNNDPSLYRQFHTGTSLRRTGKGLLWPGIGLTLGGIVLMYAGAEDIESDAGAGMFAVGYAGVFVGQALTLVSIPLSAVGGSLKKRAANGYEAKYLKNNANYQPSLNFTFTGNRAGLVIRF